MVADRAIDLAVDLGRAPVAWHGILDLPSLYLHHKAGSLRPARRKCEPVRSAPRHAIGDRGARELDPEIRDFLEPVRSFADDITIPEEGSRRLPLVSLCEIRTDGQANRVTIELPRQPVSEWENERVAIKLGDTEKICIEARLVDTIGIFATNQIAYSFTILLDEENQGARPTVDVARLLALLSLAGSAGEPSGKRWHALSEQIRFRFDDHSLELHEIAAARLRALCLHRLDDRTERKKLVDGWAAWDREHGGLPIPLWPLPNDSREVFSTLLRGLARQFTGSDDAEVMREVRTVLCSPMPTDLQGATLEIVGFDAFQRARQAIEAADRRAARPGHFTRMLSGLAQDVLDFDDQDQHEVNDSMVGGDIASDYINLVHRHTVVRLY